MKSILTCLTACLCALASAQQSEIYLAYIEQYAPMAVQEMHSVGIPASITLAQGLLESGAGTSTLAQNANNHFGIKCHRDWSGDRMYRKDDDRNAHGKLIESCFRSYDNPAQSYADHSEFLLSSPRYASLFLLEKSDYKGWAKGLKAAGYATSHTYATKLIDIIEAYELHKYDDVNYGLILADAGHIPPANKQESADFNGARPVLTGASAAVTPAASERSSTRATAAIHTANDVKYTYPQPGENLGDIARRTRRYSSDLVAYNENIDHSSSPVKPGTRVYLQPKRKSFRGKDQFHRVRQGETMQAIADQYAIKTAALYQRNHMPEGTQPRTGESIQLRGKRKKHDIVAIRSKGDTPTRVLAVDHSLEAKPLKESTSTRLTEQPPSPAQKQETDEQITASNTSYNVSTSSSTPMTGIDRSTLVSTTPNFAPTNAAEELGKPVIIDYSNPPAIASSLPAQKSEFVTVAAGDTLYSISRRSGVSVEQIKALNDLHSNTIHLGQQLVIRR